MAAVKRGVQRLNGVYRFEKVRFWCESRTMSATVVRDKRQTTLPQEVADAAGLKPGDQVEWTFEDGEIRGRKLIPVKPEGNRSLVKKGGRYLLSPKLGRAEILARIKADREAA
jgi:bifunctional DNA-binding transcriptional regulator/antitoxin component of YhaV-PrlF toxin-antitoxin module